MNFRWYMTCVCSPQAFIFPFLFFGMHIMLIYIYEAWAHFVLTSITGISITCGQLWVRRCIPAVKVRLWLCRCWTSSRSILKHTSEDIWKQCVSLNSHNKVGFWVFFWMDDFNKVYPIATVTEVSHATKFQMSSSDLQSFLLMIGSLTASR